MDVDASPTSLSFNGVYIDSKWNALFENLTPKISNLSEITPDQNQKFRSLMFSDFEQFYKNIRQNDSTLQFAESDDFLFQTTDEIGSIETSNGTYCTTLPDIRASLEAYQESKYIKSFRSFPMIKFDKDSIFKQGFEIYFQISGIVLYCFGQFYSLFRERDHFRRNNFKYVNKNSLAKAQVIKPFRKS